jgi:hypothetical protein
LGVALKAVTKIRDFVGIEYHLRDFADVCADRGF